MKHFEAAYPADRMSQLRHLIRSNLISNAAVELLERFAERYGCIARDLGMFPNIEPDSLVLTWNVPITDIRNGGRKRNTLIASIKLHASHISFQDGSSSTDELQLRWDSEMADNLIDTYRTYWSI